MSGKLIEMSLDERRRGQPRRTRWAHTWNGTDRKLPGKEATEQTGLDYLTHEFALPPDLNAPMLGVLVKTI